MMKMIKGKNKITGKKSSVADDDNCDVIGR